jgi:hypothetical protein
MNARKAFAAWAVAATLITGGAPVFAEPFPEPGPKEERAEREADLYEEGTDAIDEEKWDQAIRAFKAVAEMKGSRADGGLYWMAYALHKGGRSSEALQATAALRKNYPQSKWLDDAQALELEARQARGERVAPERIGDEDLKMIAINSLMHTDPEKAYPLLEKIVRGSSDKKIKERALFILAQSPSPRAQTLIASIARGNANPDLQKDAVKYIGIHGGAKNRAVLSELYASGASREVKKEVLRAFMIASDKARVFAAAKSETDADLRREAIHLLGVMSARAELHTLYGTETSRDVKAEIIKGLFISNDGERLGDLARNEKDAGLRREAIKSLGLIGRGTGPTLISLYNAESNVDVKKAVLEAFFLQDNARALIDLSKKETNPQLRKEALRKLSLMDDDEALAYMLQILED